MAERLIADRYEVGEAIGRGGMAEVFACTDRRLERQVAIKLLLPAMAARADIRTRFEAEARAAASLSHPNAVAVFDTGEADNGVPFIVMERLGGETLADRIAVGPVDPAWLVTVATEVLGALGAAHAVGLIHRDIKPANILLTADGRAKVADFGIAKSLETGTAGDLTVTGQVLGTPSYLAPELLDGDAAGLRSDLWSLGVTLYEAAAGVKPFEGTTALATARAVAAGVHRPLSEVRPDLDAGLVGVIERAMARDPGARFASAHDMATALTSPITGEVAAPDLAAPTVEVPGGHSGGTLVLGADELGASATDSSTVPGPETARSPQSGRRGVLIGVVVAGLVVAVVAALVSMQRESNGGSPSSVAAGPPPTGPRPATAAAPAPTTVGSTPGALLARQLRDAAGRLGSGGGPVATSLASRLQSLADQVEAGRGASDATGLLATTLGLARAGQLSADVANTVVQVLATVPGIDPSVLDALTATLAPTTDARTPAPSPGKERKGRN